MPNWGLYLIVYGYIPICTANRHENGHALPRLGTAPGRGFSVRVMAILVSKVSDPGWFP